MLNTTEVSFVDYGDKLGQIFASSATNKTGINRSTMNVRSFVVFILRKCSSADMNM